MSVTDFITSTLSTGPKLGNQMLRLAAKAGISQTALYAQSKAIGVVKAPQPGAKGNAPRIWSLPNTGPVTVSPTNATLPADDIAKMLAAGVSTRTIAIVVDAFR